MSSYDRLYHRMPDGTVKHINPFNGTEVWSVAERGRKPAINRPPEEKTPLVPHEPEDWCHFCEAQYNFTPPEKARVYRNREGKWFKSYHIPAEELSEQSAEFRRVGNLFEIVTYEYWKKNYNYRMNESIRSWKDSYLSSTAGFEHVMNILSLKKRMMGVDFDRLSIEEKIETSDPFFGGCHELLIGKRHYIPGARFQHELWSSGEMTEDEHFQYMKLAVDTIVDIYQQNPFVRNISVFQNWLKPAGASFEHIHKQLVGLDEWGVQMEREIRELIKNPNIYNEFAVNFAIYNSQLIAENDFAIAISEIGHRFPTIAVYSKSDRNRPFEHADEEIRGMSDLVHAVHCALSSQTSCNEEWYYTPFDSIYNTPWRVLIKLRINTPAGFEGNTKIYINPISPDKLAQEMVEALARVRDEGGINRDIRIGFEVVRRPNPLNYYKGNSNVKSFIDDHSIY
jgi:galactose-1-phosphate uridylyltransferase